MRRERGAGCTQRTPETQTLPLSQMSTTKHSWTFSEHSTSQQCSAAANLWTFHKPTMLQKLQVHHSILHSPRASVFSPPSKVPPLQHCPWTPLPLAFKIRKKWGENRERRKWIFIRCCPYHKQDQHSSMLASTSERLQWVGSAVAQTWYPRSNVHSQQYRHREREPQSPSHDITLPSMESCLMATRLRLLWANSEMQFLSLLMNDL